MGDRNLEHRVVKVHRRSSSDDSRQTASEVFVEGLESLLVTKSLNPKPQMFLAGSKSENLVSDLTATVSEETLTETVEKHAESDGSGFRV